MFLTLGILELERLPINKPVYHKAPSVKSGISEQSTHYPFWIIAIDFGLA
jgi:hypothetical protein